MRVNVEFRLTANSWGVRVTSSEAGGTPSVQAQMSAGTPLSGLRVGGDVRPPRKIKDVPPVYPAAAQEARVQGVVVLEARIDEGGYIRGMALCGLGVLALTFATMLLRGASSGGNILMIVGLQMLVGAVSLGVRWKGKCCR